MWWLVIALVGCSSPCPDGAELVYKGNSDGRVRACATPDGTLNGPWQEQRMDGSVALSGSYRAGAPDGVWTRTHRSGEQASQESFANGLSHGPVKRWSSDGVLLLDGTNREGKAEGRWRFWRRDGSKAREVVYEGGQPTDEHTLWNAEGVEIESCTPTVEGEPRVHCVLHHPDGTVSAEGDRLDGKNDGPWTYTFSNGVTSLEEQWTNGVRTGSTQRWHPSGQLAERGEWDSAGRGIRMGWWKRWTTGGDALPDVAFGQWSPGAAVRGAVAHPDPRALWQFYAPELDESAGAGRLGELTVIAAGKRVVGLYADGETAAFHGQVPVAVRPVAPAVLTGAVAWPTVSGHVLVVRESGWELHAAEVPDDASLHGVGSLLVVVSSEGLRAFDEERAWERPSKEPIEVMAARSDALWIREGERTLRVSPDTGSVGAPSTVPSPPTAQLVDGALVSGSTVLDPGPWRFADTTAAPWLLTGEGSWVVAFDPSLADVTVSTAVPDGVVGVRLTRDGQTLPGEAAWRTWTWDDGGVEQSRVGLDTRGWQLDGQDVFVRLEVTPERLESVDWHGAWPSHSASQALMTSPEPMLPLWAAPKREAQSAEAEPDDVDTGDP